MLPAASALKCGTGDLKRAPLAEAERPNNGTAVGYVVSTSRQTMGCLSYTETFVPS